MWWRLLLSMAELLDRNVVVSHLVLHLTFWRLFDGFSTRMILRIFGSCYEVFRLVNFKVHRQ